MARGNITVYSLGLIVILAIIAGSLSPVVGKREVFDSLPKNDFTPDFTEASDNNSPGVPLTSSVTFETEKDAAGSPSSGSWSILSNMNDIISVHCHSQLTDLGISNLYPQTTMDRSFPITTYFAELWYCIFRWNSPSGPLQQNFEVWGHDGRISFLDRCFDCQWTVQDDGFYFKYSDGQFYRVWKWT